MTVYTAHEVQTVGKQELLHAFSVSDHFAWPADDSWEPIYQELTDWCINQFGGCRYPDLVDNALVKRYTVDTNGVWDLVGGQVRFMHERDLMLFKLRWA